MSHLVISDEGTLQVGLMGLLGQRIGFRENWPVLEVSVLQIFE
jgi:hypothetical protein